MPESARFVILVDVGYLYAAAGELVLETPRRKEFRVDAGTLIGRLRGWADDLGIGEFLRLYWYDAARDRVPTVEHREVASLAHVKLRLGNLNRAGVQKGVDELLRSDLESLARNRAITDAVLVAGDEDMIGAVEAAQAFGVRVHLLGVQPKYGTNQSERMAWEADTTSVLETGFFDGLVDARARRLVPATVSTVPVPSSGTPVAAPVPGSSPPPSPAQIAELARAKHAAPTAPPRTPAASTAPVVHAPDRQTMQEVGAHVVQKWLHTRGREHLQDLLPGPSLPPVIDHELLVEGEQELGESLRPYREAREALRDGFWERVYREFGIRS
ncbi:MAG: NYN domain-containing protein [Nocardioidaceae bacterium]